MTDAEHPTEIPGKSGASIGQILVIVGLALLYGVGAYWMCAELLFGDGEETWWLKLGLPTVVVGVTILFVTVLCQRMKAATLGTNAILSLQFQTSVIMGGAAEMMAYGTAVLVEDE